MQKTIKLTGQLAMPVLGLGTWQLQGKACSQAVETALQIGYRHIDTAAAYDNHGEVAKGIKNSGVTRGKIFLTSKLWRENLRTKDAHQACERALKELKTDYLDLYLIHWPNHAVPIEETMTAMQKLQKEGKIKAIGVSNFTIHHLQDTLATGIKFVTNQVEFHPSLNQQALKNFCDEHGIVVTAYSPIAQGYDLKLPAVKELAKKYRRSESQVVLNWIIQKGMVAIPRSSDRAHIEDNFKTLEWKLATEDLAKLDQLDEGYRVVNPGFNEFEY